MRGGRTRLRPIGAYLPVVVSFLVVTSCGDGPEPMVPDLWDEALLIDAPSQGSFYSLAFSGSRGLAAGEAAGFWIG